MTAGPRAPGALAKPENGATPRPGPLDLALASRLENDRRRQAAFSTRFVFEMDLEASCPPSNSGFRLATSDAYFGWYSRLRHAEFRALTARALAWDGQGTSSRPCVFEADLGALKGACLAGLDGMPQAHLVAVDVVPLWRPLEARTVGFRTGRPTTVQRAAVSFLFEGPATTVGDYLRLVSSRSALTKLQLASPRLGRHGKVTVGGLLGEVGRAWNDGRRIDLGAAESPGRSRSFSVFQYIVVPANSADPTLLKETMHLSPAARAAQPIHLAGELMATLSRPKKGYPKDPGSLVRAAHPRSPGTVYLFHEQAVTTIARAGEDGFNQTTKSLVTMRPMYLSWLAARELVGAVKLDPVLIQRAFTEPLRREFFCWSLAANAPSRPAGLGPPFRWARTDADDD